MSTKTIFSLLGVVAALLIVLALWPKSAHLVPSTSDTQPVACTMDAKLCPDGSSVGRSGPNCEFAACPDSASSSTSTSTLKTYTGNGVTFMYPESLPTTYITAVDWPPKVAVENHALTCTQAGAVNATAGKTERMVVNGRVYCVTTEAEGAAGSTYLTYAYATEINAKTVILTFSLREVQCANYDDPQKSACFVERNTFSASSVVDSIVRTLKFI